jgi:hypothetical protein
MEFRKKVRRNDQLSLTRLRGMSLRSRYQETIKEIGISSSVVALTGVWTNPQEQFPLAMAIGFS